MAYLRIHFQPGIGVAKMCQNLGILSRDYGPERGPPGVAAGWPRFPHGRPEIAERPLGINGAPIWALIAAKNTSSLAHFSPSDSGLGMTPRIGIPIRD